MKVRRLGLFGGTFDPPHLGHVAALRAAALSGRFDRLEVCVAGDPYRKGTVVGRTALRLEMAHVAFDDLALVRVSDREVRREGPSYSIDTVRELLQIAEQVDLLVGADLVGQLDSWHQAHELRELVKVGIVPRPVASTSAPRGWRTYQIPMEPVDLSSSFVRSLVSGSENLDQYLPRGVIPLFEQGRR